MTETEIGSQGKFEVHPRKRGKKPIRYTAQEHQDKSTRDFWTVYLMVVGCIETSDIVEQTGISRATVSNYIRVIKKLEPSVLALMDASRLLSERLSLTNAYMVASQPRDRQAQAAANLMQYAPPLRRTHP